MMAATRSRDATSEAKDSLVSSNLRRHVSLPTGPSHANLPPI